jgi:hypothetical protein
VSVERTTVALTLDLSELTPEQIGVALANLPSDEWVRVFQAIADEGDRWKEEARRRNPHGFCLPQMTWMEAGDHIADSDAYRAHEVIEHLAYKLTEWKLGQLRRESRCSMFHFNRKCPSCGWDRGGLGA